MSPKARLLATRTVRGFVDGGVSVFLASWLVAIGRSEREVGAIVAATLFGSAVVVMSTGLL